MLTIVFQETGRSMCRAFQLVTVVNSSMQLKMNKIMLSFRILLSSMCFHRVQITTPLILPLSRLGRSRRRDVLRPERVYWSTLLSEIKHDRNVYCRPVVQRAFL